MAELSQAAQDLIAAIEADSGPAAEFLDVPTVGELADGPPEPPARANHAKAATPRTRPWNRNEFIRIDDVEYVYTVDRTYGTVLRLPGGKSIPLVDLPLYAGRHRKIENPLILRLSSHPLRDRDGEAPILPQSVEVNPL